MDDREMKTTPLIRTTSFFRPDLQTKLLNALINDDEETFFKSIKSNADLEHCYDYPHYKTCLDIACCNPKLHKFVKILIEYNVDVNKLNQHHNKAPIHFAVEKGDAKTINELLQAHDININILSIDNNTALNLAIKQIKKIKDNEGIKKYEEIIKMLLDAGIDSNIPDGKDNTPIHSAAKQKLENIVRLILENSKNAIDLDTYRDIYERSARDVIEQCFGNRFQNLPEKIDSKVNINLLFSHLINRKEDLFLRDFAQINDMDQILTANNGRYTLLQYSCDRGMENVVRKLLESGADPNFRALNNTESPVALACVGGYHKILKLFDKHDSASFKAVRDDSLLQIVIKEGKKCSNDENVDYEICRKILLSNKDSKSEINLTDFIKGSTALHYATKSGDQKTVLDLLRNDAYVGTVNKFGETPLNDMSPSTFEAYLDECLETNDEQPLDDDYEYKFKYNFLVPPDCNMSSMQSEDVTTAFVPETDVLLYMTKHQELKYLLNHPVITSFLFLKWQKISCLFYANITFYTMFWISLLFYIMQYYNIEERVDAVKAMVILSKYLIIIGLIILVLRELFQAILSPRKYIKCIENWLEIALIVITFNIILNEYIGEHHKQQLCAVAVLLSSAEFILLIGCFPTFSTNIEMLKTVSWNFFKFLLWYCILIIAFALSFYTLFRTTSSNKLIKNDTKTDDDEDTDFFIDPGMSLFKTIVMLTGELEAGSIDFKLFPITSHVIFIVFLFVIPIVLFNLLNGLAVSDTQAIRTNAELVGHVSRVKLISYFENIFLAKTKVRNSKRLPPAHGDLKILQWLKKKICLFPHFLPKARIAVKVNKSFLINVLENKSRYEDPETVMCCLKTCKNLIMDSKVMKSAKCLIYEKRKSEPHKNNCVCNEIKEKLNQVLELLKNNAGK